MKQRHLQRTKFITWNHCQCKQNTGDVRLLRLAQSLILSTAYNLSKSSNVFCSKIIGYHHGNKISVEGPWVSQPVPCTPQSLLLIP